MNGTHCSFDEWDRLEDPEWLRTQIRRPATSTVHGDLTIENIIISPNHPTGWYLIDPNPDNIFNSPLIDWAKLMQSLHLGYEGLNKSGGCIHIDNNINVPFTRSRAYAELHDVLESAVDTSFGRDALREVYFHEIVHYLRLTPYKMRENPSRGLTFFACTAVLLKRYLERFA